MRHDECETWKSCTRPSSRSLARNDQDCGPAQLNHKKDINGILVVDHPNELCYINSERPMNIDVNIMSTLVIRDVMT